MHQTWLSLRAAMTTGVLLSGLFITGFLLLVRPPAYETLKNVHILEKMDDYNFRMSSFDRDNNEWNPFAFTFCQSHRPTTELQPGVTIKLLKFRRDILNACADVSARNCGYIILRGEHNAPIITSMPGQTAESTGRPRASTTSN